jgi:hypothetical protein
MVKYYDIPICDNYEISKCGIVRNKITKRVKSIYRYPSGYPRTSINNKTHSIHRLLAITFIPNPDNKPLIDHIDRCRHNNNLSNLRWATWDENMNNKVNSPCNLSEEEKYERLIKKKEYMKHYNRVYQDMLKILKDDLI